MDIELYVITFVMLPDDTDQIFMWLIENFGAGTWSSASLKRAKDARWAWECNDKCTWMFFREQADLIAFQLAWIH